MMKTFEVTIAYTAKLRYTVQANDVEDAESKAWDLLNNDPDPDVGYGDYDIASIESIVESENA
jgi:hypothetical protein